MSAVEFPASANGVIAELRSLPAAFQATVAGYPDRVALRTLDGSMTLTWAEYDAEVRRVAGGLARLGVRRGDTVATMLGNRPELNVVDTAALHLGAAGVSIYNTLPPEDIRWALRDAGADIVVTEPDKLDLVLAAGAERTVILVDGTVPGTVAYDELDGPLDFEAAWRAVTPDDLAVTIFTSGTTGRPKGVELTHRAVLGNLQGLDHAIGTVDHARAISYLPMAHLAERQLSHYRAMAYGIEVTTCPDPRAMPDYLLVVRPHYFFAPPRMLAKFRAAAGDLEGDALLEHFGLDEVLVAMTGAAPVPPDLGRFWLDHGLPLVEAWGMTECGAFGAFGRPGSYRVGTCGQPLPGVDLRLADDGEILLRSPWMMRGYRGQPEATAEAIDPDGWLHTGDVGELDDGHLRIVDRKKEIIINAAGKNMSPANIEMRIKDAHPLIGEACVIGNDRPYNVALLVLDPLALQAFTGDVDSTIEHAVAAANQRLARVEQIKRYAVLPQPWVPGGDELTPTMKLKRKGIDAKHRETIQRLYEDTGHAK